MQNATHVESPCISICEMDANSGLCKGCFRTRDEIALWGAASNDERIAILDQLHDRRVALGGRDRRQTRRSSLSQPAAQSNQKRN